MPVVLKTEHYNAWLDPNTPGPKVQEIIADSQNEFANVAVVRVPAERMTSTFESLVQVIQQDV